MAAGGWLNNRQLGGLGDPAPDQVWLQRREGHDLRSKAKGAPAIKGTCDCSGQRARLGEGGTQFQISTFFDGSRPQATISTLSLCFYGRFNLQGPHKAICFCSQGGTSRARWNSQSTPWELCTESTDGSGSENGLQTAARVTCDGQPQAIVFAQPHLIERIPISSTVEQQLDNRGLPIRSCNIQWCVVFLQKTLVLLDLHTTTRPFEQPHPLPHACLEDTPTDTLLFHMLAQDSAFGLTS